MSARIVSVVSLTALVLLVFATGCADGPRAVRRSIHADFDLTPRDLADLIAPLPAHIRTVIDGNRWYFLELLDRTLSTAAPLAVLVDKTHPLPDDYEPPDLVSLTDYDIRATRRNLLLRRIVMPDLLAMVEAARIDGVELVVSSAYRSYEYQAEVYARNVARSGKAQADRESARPGKSQHQLGTTLDFGSISDDFGDTPAGHWLSENAWRYGFSLSYPDGYEALTGYRHESWHYRYLSRPVTLLEHVFFDSIQHYLLTFLYENRAALASARTD